MRAPRACLLLLIGGCVVACAAPRVPEPASASSAPATAGPRAASAAGAAPTTPSNAADDATPAGDVLTGTWGGLHVLLTLSANGGRIEYDCAQGTLDEPVRPDAHGVFHVRGQHIQNQGGPARVGDEPPAPRQATYDGSVSGDRMQLRVSSNGEAIGSYALRRGADPQMAYCL